jgi:hypothetical protein
VTKQISTAAADTSATTPMNPGGGYSGATTLALTVTGTVTVTVDVTLDKPTGSFSRWFALSDLTDKTANTLAHIAYPVTAVRLRQTAGNGSAILQVLQEGV